MILIEIFVDGKEVERYESSVVPGVGDDVVFGYQTRQPRRYHVYEVEHEVTESEGAAVQTIAVLQCERVGPQKD